MAKIQLRDTTGKLLAELEADSLPMALQILAMQGRSLPRLDLRGVNLMGADLTGLQAPAATLAGAVLDGASLKSAHLPAADLTGASLFQTHVGQATLTGARLEQVDVRGCLALARAETTRASFANPKRDPRIHPDR